MDTPAPSLRTRLLGRLAAWRHGGAPEAWSRSLWWTFSNDESIRKKGHRLAKRLYEAGLSSSGMEQSAFSHAMDTMRVIRDPKDTGWSSPENKEDGLQIWKTFEMALERGFDVNYRHYNNYCDTPLHRAAVAGRVYLTDLLLRYGADPNARDGNGYTALSATLTGFAEKIGSRENREKTARQLLDHPATDLALGRERRTYYAVSEDEIRKYEEGVLAVSDDFPELLVEMARRGAPLSWHLADYEGGRYQVPGDQSIGNTRHALFLLDHSIWVSASENLRGAWIDILKEREGDLTKLRSYRGFTPAMEFIAKGNLMGAGKSFETDQEAIESVRATIEYYVDKGVFNLTDTTDGGSNIWHSLFLEINDSTLRMVNTLMEHFPETHPLLSQENDGGVAPRDIVMHRLNGSPEQIQTRRGAVLANSRTIYHESWNDTFTHILAAIDRQALQGHVTPDAQRKDPGPNNRPRL